MPKDHWRRFRPQMYAELEKAGLLDEAASAAAREIQAKINAQLMKGTSK